MKRFLLPLAIALALTSCMAGAADELAPPPPPTGCVDARDADAMLTRKGYRAVMVGLLDDHQAMAIYAKPDGAWIALATLWTGRGLKVCLLSMGTDFTTVSGEVEL